MNNAGQQFQTATVFAGLIIFAIAGFALTALLRRAAKNTSTPGATDRKSPNHPTTTK